MLPRRYLALPFLALSTLYAQAYVATMHNNLHLFPLFQNLRLENVYPAQKKSITCPSIKSSLSAHRFPSEIYFASATPFLSLATKPRYTSSLSATITSDISSSGTKETILSPLPRLYVYDHCPFCVRARMIFGLKQIKMELFFLANDDIKTPTSLIGKKMAPILFIEAQGNEKNLIMPESMDIVKYIDENIGGPTILQPASEREDIADFFKSVAVLMRRLTRPRISRTALLPEFAFESGRSAYIRNHPFKEEPLDYEENFRRTSEYLNEMNKRLEALETMIYCSDHVSPHGLSYDDIDFFGKLRGLTIVKGIQMGPKLEEYLNKMSQKTDIPLYYQISI